MTSSDFDRRRCCSGLVAGLGLLAWAPAASAGRADSPDKSAGLPPPAQRDVRDWLLHLQEASRRRSYVGTFVVLSSAGAMSSSRIWHACDGDQQFERVEALSGTARSTFRHNDRVVTFLPDERVVRVERRQSLDLFPNLLQGNNSLIPDFYSAQLVGVKRVAGFEADVIEVQPKDGLRFGYRIWSEKRTGLVVKLQTLDAAGTVLEQAAFSELAIDVPVKTDRMLRMMDNTAGYRIDRLEPVKTTPEREGWSVASAPAAGFAAMECYRRTSARAHAVPATMQCVFSDGLASVSLFLEPYDAERHGRDSAMAVGATHTVSQRLDDQWWLTAVGEVPPQTLRAFAGRFVRAR